MALSNLQQDDVLNGRYRIVEGVGAPEAMISSKPPDKVIVAVRPLMPDSNFINLSCSQSLFSDLSEDDLLALGHS